MKKALTLCLFVFALLAGTESVFAQSSNLEINKMASKKTETLRRYVKFDNNQRDLVFDTYKKYFKLKTTSNTSDSPETLQKIESFLETEMKAILNEEQYEKYKSLSK